jgi:hypothetical protein
VQDGGHEATSTTAGNILPPALMGALHLIRKAEQGLSCISMLRFGTVLQSCPRGQYPALKEKWAVFFGVRAGYASSKTLAHCILSIFVVAEVTRLS